MPPTQLPQLSINAVPLAVLLQSTGSLVVKKVSTGDHHELLVLPDEQKDLTCQTYVVLDNKLFNSSVFV